MCECICSGCDRQPAARFAQHIAFACRSTATSAGGTFRPTYSYIGMFPLAGLSDRRLAAMSRLNYIRVLIFSSCVFRNCNCFGCRPGAVAQIMRIRLRIVHTLVCSRWLVSPTVGWRPCLALLHTGVNILQLVFSGIVIAFGCRPGAVAQITRICLKHTQVMETH